MGQAWILQTRMRATDSQACGPARKNWAANFKLFQRRQRHDDIIDRSVVCNCDSPRWAWALKGQLRTDSRLSSWNVGFSHSHRGFSPVVALAVSSKPF